MMKAYINIKNNSNLHAHQTLNKRIGLMKRENGRSPTHHFSFGERFDETLMKGYCISCQHIILPNHQFIGFPPSTSPQEKQRRRTPPSAGRSDGLLSCRQTRESRCRWRKEKGNRQQPTSSPTPPQAFGKQKAIAH